MTRVRFMRVFELWLQKSQRIKVQLRDGDGQIQDPEVQLQQLMQHYKKLYAADEDREIV